MLDPHHEAVRYPDLLASKLETPQASTHLVTFLSFHCLTLTQHFDSDLCPVVSLLPAYAHHSGSILPQLEYLNQNRFLSKLSLTALLKIPYLQVQILLCPKDHLIPAQSPPVAWLLGRLD